MDPRPLLLRSRGIWAETRQIMNGRERKLSKTCRKVGGKGSNVPMGQARKPRRTIQRPSYGHLRIAICWRVGNVMAVDMHMRIRIDRVFGVFTMETRAI
jgi:hypothetical protein